jgi:hypothetical protein
VSSLWVRVAPLRRVGPPRGDSLQRALIRLPSPLVIDEIVDAVTNVPRVELTCVLRHRRFTAVSGFFTGRLVLAAFILDKCRGFDSP